jgi:hypothetical protein
MASMTIASCSTTNSLTNDLQSAINGEPYGRITDHDIDRLVNFAKSKSYDMYPDLKNAFDGDVNALSRIFAFSTSFDNFNLDARTYGQIIYNSFLSLGEGIGPQKYSDVVNIQKPEVQQRIRDFIYYPITLVPTNKKSEVEKEVRSEYTGLFPSEYKFSEGNQLFSVSN